MSIIKSVFKNTSWLMISQIVTSVLGFFWTILIARYLGVFNFGIITFATSFTGIAAIGMDIGFSTYATRNVARDPSLTSKYLGNGILLKLILSLLTIIAILILLKSMNYDYLTIEVCFIFSIQISFLTMSYLFNGIFQAHEKMQYQAVGIIINSGLLLGFTLISIYLNIGVIGIAITYLLSSVITSIYLYMRTTSKIAMPKFEIDLKFWKNSIKSSFAFGLTNFFTNIYFMIDTVMISIFIGATAVGIYSSAYKIIFVFTTLYSVYNFVIFPLMAKLYTNSEELLKISYEKSVKYLLMIILPLAVGITFYADSVILLIYGNEFSLAANVLKILIWNVVFLFVNGASTLLLNSSNHEIGVTKINGIACFFNVVLNLILIYYLSYIGAAIATVLTGLLIAILMNNIISKNILKIENKLIIEILKISFSALILAIVLFIFKVSLLIAIPLGIIIYSVMIILTKTLDTTDKSMITEIIK
ncbi:teichuronic acid biosynthesis protein TuaB [Methanobrevibacter cuticularis]|uniref:Teichuronic acid biosynthesis protein TuaB n=1 Tax=Methanobrevibacter cuticularis TaxID=47311 RepID=A0A166EFN2_9EURY|nr:flippase [Methanobrevibacter cuticularis]KZX16598.1 teichuronic acid biosynthesis protein TuaB [Methanobrevibacter cuticularis]